MCNSKNFEESILFSVGFEKCKSLDCFSDIGQCYELLPEIGEGHYWIYRKKDLFSINIMKIVLKEDKIMEVSQPDFIEVNYFDSVSGEELLPYKQLTANCIRGHISESGLYRARFHKNIPINNVEIQFKPKYYKEYLKDKYAYNFSNIKGAFSSIDGVTDFPELVVLLRQIQSFKGSGKSADMYYESKVNEAMSLIIEKSKKINNINNNVENRKYLNPEDLENLDAVKCYIYDHFAVDIRTSQLAEIAFMSQTKLRASFKEAYGCTITEFIKSRRIATAESLLIRTNFSIAQVAEAVGFRQASRFSDVFHKSTGFLPYEYRKVYRNTAL